MRSETVRRPVDDAEAPHDAKPARARPVARFRSSSKTIDSVGWWTPPASGAGGKRPKPDASSPAHARCGPVIRNDEPQRVANSALRVDLDGDHEADRQNPYVRSHPCGRAGHRPPLSMPSRGDRRRHRNGWQHHPSVGHACRTSRPSASSAGRHLPIAASKLRGPMALGRHAAMFPPRFAGVGRTGTCQQWRQGKILPATSDDRVY